MILKTKALLQTVFALLRNFIIFFLVISFIVTCSFLVGFASVTLSEEDVRTFAPIVFFNVFILSALFVASDFIRRRVTVDRPAKEIDRVLRRLTKGDFAARISLPSTTNAESHFGDIAAGINTLAGELSGVETLRTDFIANVSHEMKTPLSVMQNYATLLQAPDLTEAERLRYAKAVTDGSRRLADMVTNMLKLNRLENQQIYPDLTEYDLGEQLCECLLQYESVWEEAGIEIETNLAENVRIKTDSELLQLVWNNLLSNAFKFTERGGKVTVTLTATEHHAVVQVQDTGCGMTAEVGAHIFEKFYQGDTSHAGQGNGLGLALVKRVVDILHGEICVQSIYGQGSTFTVRIRRNEYA